MGIVFPLQPGIDFAVVQPPESFLVVVGVGRAGPVGQPRGERDAQRRPLLILRLLDAPDRAVPGLPHLEPDRFEQVRCAACHAGPSRLLVGLGRTASTPAR